MSPRPVPTSHRGSRSVRRAIPVAAVLGLVLTGCGASDDGPHVTTERAVPSNSPWTTVAIPGRGVDETSTVVAGPDGAMLVAGGVGRPGVASSLVAVAADGSVRPTRRVPGILGVAGWGRRAVYLRGTGDGRRVGVSSGPLDARTLGREQVLHRGGPTVPTLAVGPRGDVLVATGDGDADLDADFVPRRIGLHWTVPGRGWSTRALPGEQELLATDVDARGVATLLLERSGAARRAGARPGSGGPPYLVVTRTFDLGSGRLGGEHVLERSTRDFMLGAVSSNARGDTVLAWGEQDGGEEADTKYAVRAALRFGGRFRPTQVLDSSGDAERPDSGPVAAMDDAGGATVGWTQVYDTPDFDVGVVPRIATVSGPGRFGPSRQPLRWGRVSGAATSGSTTLVAVTGSSGHHETTRDEPPRRTDHGGVVVRSGGVTFGPLEPVGRSSVRGGPEVGLAGGPAGLRAVWTGHVARRHG